jgi:hypothetical protein
MPAIVTSKKPRTTGCFAHPKTGCFTPRSGGIHSRAQHRNLPLRVLIQGDSGVFPADGLLCQNGVNRNPGNPRVTPAELGGARSRSSGFSHWSSGYNHGLPAVFPPSSRHTTRPFRSCYLRVLHAIWAGVLGRKSTPFSGVLGTPAKFS